MKRTAQAALALLIFTTLFSCHNLVVKLMPPEGDKITSFILADEVALISDNSITVTVPPSTDISALVPLIRAQDGATVIPITYEYITQAFPNAKAERLVSDWLSTNNKTDWALKVLKENPTFTVPELTTPINFTMPTLFAVISGQGTTRLYTVTVSGGKVMLPLPTEKNKLFSFTVDGQIGQSVIDHGSPETGSGSVTFTVPQSVNLRSLIPTVTASENAFVLPLTFNYLLRSFINADLFDLFMGYYLASDKSAYLQQKMQNLEGFVMPSKTLDLPIDFSATVPFAVVAWDYSISLYEVKATRVNTDAQLTDFILSKALNPELVRDAQGTIDEAKKTVSMTAWLPAEYTPAKQYIPTFTLAGQSDSAFLSVDSTPIENNVTAIDCTSPQKTLSVSRTINSVTTKTDYTLLIDYKEDPDTVRSITDLRFTKKNNPSLLVNCITSIHDAKEIGTIKVSIPHTGAQPPRLVVDYISGGVVTDEFMQSIYSGTTTDTPHTRTLVCTSRDGTLQRRYTLLIDYIAVEGTGLPELQSFSFSALINEDLSKAVTARIDHVNNVIFAEIPYTSASYPRILIPEFSASGTVSVTSAPQISGISGQDFSRLVTYTVTSFWDPSVTKQYSVQLAYSKAVVQNTHVLFYANGGSVTPEYVSVQKGSSVNSLPTPERVNFTFTGWYTQITDGQKINAPYTPQTDTTLYAQWAGTSYTVSFNANGGTGTMSPQTFTSGVAQNLSANTFSKTGNYFVGWNTAQDGSGTYYADGAIPTASSGNVELYAQWAAKTCTVHFNANSATGTMNAQAFTYGIAQNLTTNAFSKTGYTFVSWNTAKDGNGTQYADGAVFSMGLGDITLYAQWKANVYEVTFNQNGGTGGQTQNVQATFDQQMPSLSAPAPAKAGAYFTGYFDSQTDGVLYYAADMKSAKPCDFTADKTLYAQWSTAPVYTITFYPNYTNAEAGKSQSAQENTSVTLQKNSFTRAGYSFKEWNTKEDGSGTQYADEAAYPLGNSDTALYAQWTINTYTLTFNANDGSSTPSTTTQTFTFGTLKNLTANGFSKIGHTFNGWMDNSGTPYADGAQYTMVTEGATLFAQWTANDYTLTFNANGGTPSSTTTQTFTFGTLKNLTANGFSKIGHTFNGWMDNSGTSYADGAQYTMVTEGATLFAQWKANTYTLTFNANNGTPSPSTTTQTFTFGSSKSLTANSFYKTGYRFKEWNTTPNGGGTSYANYASYTIKDAPVTLYAQWTANTYTVTFNSNGTGTSGTMANQAFTYDTPTNLSANTFKKVGHYFTGWTTAANGTGGTYADGVIYATPATNITLYAQWTPRTLLYVKSNATGLDDGSSWANAYTTLQKALTERKGAPSSTTVSIYIANTSAYTPDVDSSFSLQSNTKLYGGFSGTEATPEARSPGAKTALKGNGKEVIRAQGQNITLDGLEVSDGKGILGGGVFITSDSSGTELINCVFRNNNALYGGGAYIHNSTVTGCIFKNNSSSENSSGGGANIINSTVTDCLFENNNSKLDVGGANIENSTVINCTFKNNTSNSGCAVKAKGTYFEYCTFEQNRSGRDYPKDLAIALPNDGDVLKVLNSNFSNNEAIAIHGPSTGMAFVYLTGSSGYGTPLIFPFKSATIIK